jgi:hypothetical protein
MLPRQVRQIVLPRSIESERPDRDAISAMPIPLTGLGRAAAGRWIGVHRFA